MDLPLPKKSKMKPTKSKMKPTSSSERGVCYFSHVPHGFFEKEMREFLTQFGTVTNLRIGKYVIPSQKPVTVNIKRLSHLSPSSGNSIVWRADSWRRRNATPQLSALPNDGVAARWR